MGAKVECSVQHSDQGAGFPVSQVWLQTTDKVIARLSDLRCLHAVMHDQQVRLMLMRSGGCVGHGRHLVKKTLDRLPRDPALAPAPDQRCHRQSFGNLQAQE